MIYMILVLMKLIFFLTDMKVASRASLAAGQQFWAEAGPTHSGGLPPFSWANTNLTSLPLHTPITTFDFQPEQVVWQMKEVAHNPQAFRDVPLWIYLGSQSWLPYIG